MTWLPAADAVAMAERGEMLMMPPTYLTSLEVGAVRRRRPRWSTPRTAAPSRCTRPAWRRWGTAGRCRSAEHLRSLLAAHQATLR